MKRARVFILSAVAALAVGSAGYGVATAAAPGADTPAKAAAAAAKAPMTAATPTSNPETYFVPVAPCRIVNTSGHGGNFGPHGERTYYVTGTTGFGAQGGQAGGCGIPAGATAIAARFSTMHPAGSGALAASPTNQTSTIGTLYYNKGQRASVSVTQPISTNAVRPLTILNGVGKGVDLTIDVTGYWIPQIHALIAADGTISTGTDRVVSASHAGTGFYYVTLDRPARDCSIQATAYNLSAVATAGLSSASTPNVISVATMTFTNVLSDHSFFLTVTC